MRLTKVEHGHTAAQKAILARIEAARGERVPDVLLTLFYRMEFFGQPFSDCLEEKLRGPSEWSLGEREVFAAFVSSKNQCVF